MYLNAGEFHQRIADGPLGHSFGIGVGNVFAGVTQWGKPWQIAQAAPARSSQIILVRVRSSGEHSS